MRKILVVGVDSSLHDSYQLATEVFSGHDVEKLFIPSSDYYNFDFDELSGYSPDVWAVFVAVNEFYINDVRRSFFECITAFGYQVVSLTSPRSYISSDARIGRNVIVYPGCHVGAGVVLGDCSVLRSNVVVGDGSNIGNYVTLEANVSIRELCTVGSFTTVCANSSIMRSTVVGEHCYLNLSKQYFGKIPACTFYSPMFENPIRVFQSVEV